ncbi:unnamed protein product [Rotaria sp. Silwood1]|nr:unnamed protein product [Rotaria sp. Silwood1]
MSVWQDYLFSLAYVYPAQEIQFEITDRVFDLLKILLHHAIKYEYGGWHIWIDTLSILYGRITKEDYYRKVNQIVERKLNDSQIPIDEQNVSTPTKSTSSRQVFKTNQLPPFTISEFKYSPMHIRLLHSVFDSIEVDIRLWRSSSDSTKSITDAINNPDNQIFCANIIHIIS